jgi:hypothetical protein
VKKSKSYEKMGPSPQGWVSRRTLKSACRLPAGRQGRQGVSKVEKYHYNEKDYKNF